MRRAGHTPRSNARRITFEYVMLKGVMSRLRRGALVKLVAGNSRPDHI